jgi:hypothetical protein
MRAGLLLLLWCLHFLDDSEVEAPPMGPHGVSMGPHGVPMGPCGVLMGSPRGDICR